MIWLPAILAAALLIWWWRKGMKPVANELSDAEALWRGLRLLMARGVYKAGIHGTLSVCLRDDPKCRLIFAKFIDGETIGFRASLPREQWMEPYRAGLEAELVRRGMPFRLGTAQEDASFSFDLVTDYGGAYVTARVVFDDIMGKSLHRDCVMYFRDCVTSNTPRLTGIDSPDDNWG